MLLLFDDCVLDLDRRELMRASEVVATTPRVWDLLAYLVRNHERVVGRDDLIAAVWGGRIVSESTVASHINAARKAVGDDGQQQRVIKTMARRGFRFVADVREQAADGAGVVQGGDAPPLPPARPSIAVLSFVNLSADAEQDYLADGVVEDIIAALSRYRWLFVVARNSSFTYKGRAVDVKQIGRELGVRYVLEGSWRKAGNRVRITGQLIDAATGAHHWAGRFEGVLDDIFELQDQIAASVVGAIAPELERAEIERSRNKPTENLDAYDYYLRGMAKLHHGTEETIDEALRLLRKSIEFDPDFSTSHAMAAWCYCWRKANGWMVDRERESEEGTRLARRAVALDKSDAVALSRCGHAIAYLANDVSGGVALLDKALMLNPNLAAAWYLGGYMKIWQGDIEAAIDSLARAIRLSPLDPELYRMQGGMAIAHLFKRDLVGAAAWAEKAMRELPSFLLAVAVLAASRALEGRMAEAQQAMEQLRQLNPSLSLGTIGDWLPNFPPENRAVLMDGLARAGLPE
jgi:TolB-like protein/predicted Zn-dependent protease